MTQAALRALIDDLERIETMVRVRSPELGTEKADTHVDVLAATREIVRHPTLGQIPVVICSGKKTLCDFVWATKCGAAGFVVKPLDDAKDLVRTIRAAVKNAQQGSRLDLVL